MCCGRLRAWCSPPACYATRGSDRLPMPVDDPTPRQVVRRKLDLHPVSRQDPDAVKPHLPRRVAEGLVAVVEHDAILAVAQRFDDLAFELDLLFLAGHLRADLDDVHCLRALGAFALLELDLGTLGEALEAVAGDVGVVDEDILRAVLGRDEAVALGIVEPLDGSACHIETPPCCTHERARKALCA